MECYYDSHLTPAKQDYRTGRRQAPTQRTGHLPGEQPEYKQRLIGDREWWEGGKGMVGEKGWKARCAWRDLHEAWSKIGKEKRTRDKSEN